MKKYLFGVFAMLWLCYSCSPSYKLANTVWYNVTPCELDGTEGNVFTSIYFLDDNQMCINTSVESNNEMIVSPTATSYGEYKYEGNLKKGVSLTITQTDIWGEPYNCRGVITTDGLFLMETDTTARVYHKASNLTLKKE